MKWISQSTKEALISLVPSGTGKSTIFALLLDYIAPDAGEAYVAAERGLIEDAPDPIAIGMVFSKQLYLTLWEENVDFFALSVFPPAAIAHSS